MMLILLLCCVVANAQEQHAWEQLYSELLETEEQENIMSEEDYDLLCSLEMQPIDLNKATREDLEQLPFLSPTQIEDILAYIYQYHGMRSVGELLMIESLDDIRCRLLSHFVTIKVDDEQHYPALSTILRRGKHNILFTAKVPFYIWAIHIHIRCAISFLIPIISRQVLLVRKMGESLSSLIEMQWATIIIVFM